LEMSSTFIFMWREHEGAPLWLLSYPGPIPEDGNGNTVAFGKKN
jgi:hypothetical protein